MTRLALIAKEPVAGHAKTRLAAGLGAAGSAELAAAMLRDTAEALARLAPAGAELLLYHDPPDAAGRLAALGLPARFRPLPQPAGSLGARLAHLVDAQARDGRPLVVVAADAPHAAAGVLDALPARPGEIVLAPCEDGGYWAVGLDAPAPIFDVPMSAGDVVGATVACAATAGRPVRLLAPTLDLDVPDDLAAAEARGLLAAAPRTRAAYLRLRAGGAG